VAHARREVVLHLRVVLVNVARGPVVAVALDLEETAAFAVAR
jgi:hypothetical protein